MSFDLRRERVDRGLTQAALAALTGVSRSTLIRIEQEGTAPNPPVAKAIADWLDSTPTELWPEMLDRRESPPEPTESEAA